MTFENSQSEQYRVLIIDPDYEKYYRGLSTYLKECKLIAFNNHREGREYFLQTKVDLLIFDHINEKRFRELLNYFKSARPSMPVIALTSCSSEELAVTALKNGARDYFRKPFTIEEFVKSIRYILSFRKSHNRRRADYCHDNFRLSLDYVLNNYNRKLSLNEVARKAGMSISCFERTFKNNMGETFVTYLNNHRIAKSKEMLRNKAISICDVAFHSGFSNQYHFARTFRKIMNISPRQFRSSLK